MNLNIMGKLVAQLIINAKLKNAFVKYSRNGGCFAIAGMVSIRNQRIALQSGGKQDARIVPEAFEMSAGKAILQVQVEAIKPV